MAEKILNTRIQLKYDTLANWNASTVVLKKGELAICVIETNDPAKKHLQPVMFKVGTGDKVFSDLDWASAKAADVYGWAKQAGITVEDNGTGSVVSDIEWKEDKLVITRIDVYTKEEADARFQPVGNYKTKQTTYSNAGSKTKTITGVTQNENGEVAVTYEDIAFPSIDTGIMGVTGDKVVKATTTDGVVTLETQLDNDGNVKFEKTDSGLKATVDTGVMEIEAGDDAINITYEGDEGEDNPSIPRISLMFADDESGEAGNVKFRVVDGLGLSASVNTGVMSVTGTPAIEVNTTNGAATVSLKLATGDNTGNVALSQDANGLKADIDLSSYATKEEVDDIIDKVIADVTDQDTIEGITSLVEYVNANGGDLAAITKEIYGGETIGETSRIDTAVADAAAAVSTANNASIVAGEAKTIAEGAATVAGEAKALAEEAKTGATNSAAAADASAKAAGQAQALAEAARAGAEEAQAAAEDARNAAQEGQKAAVEAQRKAEAAQAAAEAAQGIVAADKATVAEDKGIVAADKAIVAADKAAVAEDKAAAEAAKLAAEAAQAAAGEAQAAAEAAQGLAEAAKGEAAGSAATASGHADSASNKAAQAAQSATNAGASESAAKLSETNAAASESAASKSAAAAAASESAASESAAAAAADAKSAGEAAEAAESAKGLAEAAKGEAAGSASAAAKSETNAGLSATAADESAQAAAKSYSDANEAKVAAEKAKSDANDILTQVTDAASGAQATADSAVQTANTAAQDAAKAKSDAAAAVKTADDTKAAFDAFMTSIDGDTEGVIDTLAEINKYITEDTEAFTELSKEVDKNTQAIAALSGASGKVAAAEKADVASALDADGQDQVKGIKVNNAGHADTADSATDSAKLGGKAAADYVLKTEAPGYDDILTKTSAATLYQPAGNYQPAGDYKTKQTAVADPTASGTTLSFIASISQNENGVVTATKKSVDVSGLATKAQGDKADTAVQDVVCTSGMGLKATKADNVVTLDWDTAVTLVFDCGDSKNVALN